MLVRTGEMRTVVSNNAYCLVISGRLLTGFRLFDKDLNQAEVVSMLLGYTAMPFEANPALFQSINAPPNAQNMLRQMLQRNPTARPALKDVGHAYPSLLHTYIHPCHCSFVAPLKGALFCNRLQAIVLHKELLGSSSYIVGLAAMLL